MREGPPAPSSPSPTRLPTPASTPAPAPGAATQFRPEPSRSVPTSAPDPGGRHLPGLEAALDTLLSGSHCALGGWSEAIDLALARPDLVVVTRDGDRFSSAGWRVRAGGGVVTAAVVDEARARATTAAAAAAESAAERTMARSAVESTRTAALEAVRSDDRNEVEHQTARAARQRVAGDRLALASELEEVRRTAAELDDRIARDTARAVELREQLPDPGGGADRGRREGCRRPRRAQADRRAHRRGGLAPERMGGPLGRPGRTAPGPE